MQDVELLVVCAPGLLLGRGGADTLVHLTVNEKLRKILFNENTSYELLTDEGSPGPLELRRG